jgi:hypothetical protein
MMQGTGNYMNVKREGVKAWVKSNGGARNWLVGIPTGQIFFQSIQKQEQTPIIFSQHRKPQTNAYI